MSYITDVLQKQQVLKHFFLTGENEMVKSVFSQVHGSERYYITLINVVHINKIYILTLYSGYFGKNPGILGSMIIKICANIKLNKVVYIQLQNKSVYQYFFT